MKLRMMTALLASAAAALVVASGANATEEVRVFDGVGGFEKIAIVPTQVKGESWDQVIFCLNLSEAERQHLAAEGDTPAAWDSVDCLGILRPAGTTASADIPALAGEYLTMAETVAQEGHPYASFAAALKATVAPGVGGDGEETGQPSARASHAHRPALHRRHRHRRHYRLGR